MSDYLPPEHVRDIVRPALIRNGVTWNQIVREERARYLIEARRDVYLALREAGLSLPEIGAIVRRHHTTVLHHLNAIERANYVNVHLTWSDGRVMHLRFEGDVDVRHTAQGIRDAGLTIAADVEDVREELPRLLDRETSKG